MLSFQDVADAGFEERDAVMRALAEDMLEASGRYRGGRGFVSAERPRDRARALGRDRRERRPQRRAC
ncbi:hypothetical protein SAMN05216360_101548 [Methylobacterium phyllostachyos]|uniref:Uncharacterized protein n=1 Tax=Methylobacterium phyllostachyos TaxID=582672 RepID=A0A1G9S9C7_9HYPH|nr:hypothetical protein [Methylobacterium phyllostachyos]SDM32056.1 hypothetical protein SAMN05216360_101548 [Methylobacterium phyllostachyos]